MDPIPTPDEQRIMDETKCDSWVASCSLKHYPPVEEAIRIIRKRAFEKKLQYNFERCVERFAHLHSWDKYPIERTVYLVPVIGNVQEAKSQVLFPGNPENIFWHLIFLNFNFRFEDFNFVLPKEVDPILAISKRFPVQVLSNECMELDRNQVLDFLRRPMSGQLTEKQRFNLIQNANNETIEYGKNFARFYPFFQKCCAASELIIEEIAQNHKWNDLPKYVDKRQTVDPEDL